LVSVDFDFVEDERVRSVVGLVLGEDDAFDQAWIEVVDGGCGEFGEGNFDLGPMVGGEIADEFAKFQSAGKLGICVADANLGKSAGGDAVGRVAPEEKIAADESNFAVAETHHVDAGVPAAGRRGSPFETERVGRRVENSCFDGEFAVNEI